MLALDKVGRWPPSMGKRTPRTQWIRPRPDPHPHPCSHPQPQPVNGDIKIKFIHKKGSVSVLRHPTRLPFAIHTPFWRAGRPSSLVPPQGKEKLCHLWLNTFFVDDLKFTAKQPEIDKVRRPHRTALHAAL